MATTYDWSPLFDAINGATNKWSQQNQYNSMLKGLIGNQVPGQTNLGLSAMDPQQTTINATAPNIPGAPAPVQRSVNASIPGMAGTAATQGAPTYDGMAGQALGANAGPMLSMLRNAPPSIGLPLLLNLATKNAERQQTIQDARITPLSDDEAKATLGAAWKPDAKYGRDISGNVVTIQKGETLSQAAVNQQLGIKRSEGQIEADNPLTKYQAAAIAHQNAALSEDRRRNQADENAKLHPFGIGTGSDATGADFLKTLPPGVAGQIKAIAEYRQAPPANRATPAGVALMSAVNQFNPSYDASQYGAKVKARNDFTTGKNGNNVRSLNVAVQHLEQLGGLSSALGNGDIQGFNRLSQFVSQQTGNPAPTNFDGVKQMVGDEIVKAVVGAGGGVHDREEIANNISRASSPQQLQGVIKQYQGLLGGQLRGLKQQYEKSTGLTDFESYLDPLTRTKLEGGESSGNQTKTIGGVTYHLINGKWMQ